MVYIRIGLVGGSVSQYRAPAKTLPLSPRRWFPGSKKQCPGRH